MENDARKFEFFCDAICGVYCGIKPEQSTDRTFDAEFSAIDLGGPIAATISAPGHRAHRSAAMIRRRPDDAVFLNYSAVSGFRARHAERPWDVAAAMPFVLDNRQPFDLDFERTRPMRLHTLRIPAAAVADLTPDRLCSTNLAIATTTTGRQLALQMHLFCQALDTGSVRLAAHMSAAVLELLNLLIQPEARGSPESRSLFDIKSVAASRISDPDFGLMQLAAIVRCSARTLQKRFADSGETFTDWLLEQRLCLARDRLISPATRGRSIEAIACACGFRDASHFHRAFRKRFGMSPGAARR